jgi:hypothetical protein
MVQAAVVCALLLAVLHRCVADGVVVSGRVMLPPGVGSVRLLLDGGEQETLTRSNGEFELHDVAQGTLGQWFPPTA